MPSFRPAYTNMRHFWLQVSLAILIALFVYWFRSYISPNIGYDLHQPVFAIENAGPCIKQGNEMVRVEHFEPDRFQYICGNLITDTEPLHLTLLVYKSENITGWGSEYVVARQLSNGPFAIDIYPSLPEGDYRAQITYARDSAATLWFSVTGKK
ncbi:MAG: hypothetical protein L6461_10165 [Anaerolineae bacterium]|nr:hypothetical protein [Anaerolineae bacterium]